MNQIFSLKRFSLLFKKHLAENYKGYLMSIGVLIGIITFTLIFVCWMRPRPVQIKEQIAYFIIFMLLSGTIFTSNVFVNLGDKRKAIATLTLPASTLEKFLIGWLWSFVIFQVIFIAVYYFLLTLIIHSFNWQGQKIELLDFHSTQPEQMTYVAYFFLNAIVLYGAIYFKKMHFIKTAFALFIVVFVIWLVNDQVLNAMLGQRISGNPPFTGASLQAKNNFYNVELKADFTRWIQAMFLTMSVLIWSAAYFRLKEKQV